MNKAVQILLLAAFLLPMVGHAREETLEERKRRITRKYLRERATLSQSDMLVPVDELPEDGQIADSEKFIQPEVDFERQEGGVVPPQPQPLRPQPRRETRNWLLVEDPMAQDDPYADSFQTELPEEEKKQPLDPWSSWEKPGESSAYSRPDSRYGRQEEAKPSANGWNSAYGDSRPGYTDSRSGQGRNPSAYSPRSGGLFGNQRQESPAQGSLAFPPPRNYGSSPDTGLLNSPFQTGTPAATRSSENETDRPGYTPYQSPYRDRRVNQAMQQPGSQTQDQEYKRENPFQQWKKKNNTWDPMSDDAYVDELMRKNRR